MFERRRLGKARSICLLLLVVASVFGCATNETTVVEVGSNTTLSDSKVSCGLKLYVNDAGVCVSEPLLSAEVPFAATAKCKEQFEGKYWYSFSQVRRGTCSQFGGVLQWCQNGKCDDK